MLGGFKFCWVSGVARKSGNHMPLVLQSLLMALAANAVVLLALWLLSLRLHDASIIDIYWGLGVVLMAAAAAAVGEAPMPRKLLVVGLTALWGLRLAGYLAWRNLGHGEDHRYQAMRRKHGERFGWVSLRTVFGLQCLLGWLVAMPVIVTTASAGAPAPWTVFDATGLVLFAMGLAFETVGDIQLARFKADPSNQGRVMDRGLWRYTRHPNYFGDAVLWWGLWLVASSSPGGVLTILSPVVMSFLLMRVSGVPMLEYKLMRTRPGYEEYVGRTSAFFPRPPRTR
jgi:steroid 5-alpha reductase family enzyme